MPFFRKKPVVIEAFQWTERARGDMGEWPDFVRTAFAMQSDEYGALWTRPDVIGGGTTLFVRTLEGPLTVAVNDWIIKGVQGELYPCAPDIFELTYEPASGNAQV